MPKPKSRPKLQSTSWDSRPTGMVDLLGRSLSGMVDLLGWSTHWDDTVECVLLDENLCRFMRVLKILEILELFLNSEERGNLSFHNVQGLKNTLKSAVPERKPDAKNINGHGEDQIEKVT
uniref:Uncharacterized protein n=1 Tax=Romanomermis culicivorax TaxID=13658 RepID=A0A915ILJ2_ROMCU